MHADFGSGLWNGGPIGIPITVVDSSQATSPVDFHYADESDPGPYPIPSDVAIEGGPISDGDRHAIIVDSDSCELYELYSPLPVVAGGLGRHLDLTSNALPPSRLDVGGCGRPADSPGSCPLRGGCRRAHRPRDPLHRRPLPPRLHLPGAPLRRPHEQGAAAHGAPPAPAPTIRWRASRPRRASSSRRSGATG